MASDPEHNMIDAPDQQMLRQTAVHQSQNTSPNPSYSECACSLVSKTAPQNQSTETVELGLINPDGDAPLSATPSLTDNEQRPGRIPTRKYRLSHYLWALHLLIPVAISIGILQLSFRDLYWHDTRVPGTSETLAVFQVAAKAHEILIVYSLSRIVLYYLLSLLGSSSGLPFGLFASSYGQYLGKPPIDFSFWSSLVSLFRNRRVGWKAFFFALLVLCSTLISLAAGPASAIALIPQLKWWHTDDIFSFIGTVIDSELCNYQKIPHLHPKGGSLHIPKPLFPSTVDNASLPGSSCLDASLDEALVCPFYGLLDLPEKLNWTSYGNSSIGVRTMASQLASRGRKGPWDERNFAQVWTTNQLLSYFLDPSPDSYSIYKPEALAVEGHVSQSRVVPSPTVKVSCHVEKSTDFVRDVANGTFDIRDIWNEDTLLKPPATQIEFREFSDTNKQPLLVGFILMRGDTQIPGNVSICHIRARWVASDLYLLPFESLNVRSNFTFPDKEDPQPDLNVYPTINIRKEWADVLDTFNSTANSTTLVEFIENSMNHYQSVIGLGKAADENTDYASLQWYPAGGHALMLSTAIANGLSSIGQEVTQNLTFCRGGWCSQKLYFQDWANIDIFYDSPDGTTTMNATGPCNRTVEYPALIESQPLRSFKEPSKSFRDAHWTEISYPIFQYGYGWSLNSSATKFSTVILLLHALIIIVHVFYILISGLTYSYGDSIADLLVLALESKPPGIFNTAKGQKFQDEVWTRSTKVRQTQSSDSEDAERLEIIIDNQLKHRGVSRRRR